MYVSPDHVRDIFKKGVDQVGKSPYITVEIGSIDNLETFLNAAIKQKKISGYSYETRMNMVLPILLLDWCLGFL